MSFDSSRCSEPLFPDRNPFRTDAIRPGAIEFLLPACNGMEMLVERFLFFGGRGQIVGPHGSGKSTLVQTLVRPLTPHYPQIEAFRLNQEGLARVNLALSDSSASSVERLALSAEGPADPTATFADLLTAANSPRTLVIVEGCERWSLWRRWRLLRWCDRTRAGLMVTAHRRLLAGPRLPHSRGLPQLYRMQPDAARFAEVVRRCCPQPPQWWNPHWVEQAFERHQPNLREALFELYDRYERGRRGAGEI